MNKLIISILLVLIGIFVGIITVVVINYIRGLAAIKKISKMIEDAKKNADKIKRESILEAKDEAHKIKIDLEKEIK